MEDQFKTLKELITAHRECKTNEQRRQLILRESAIIRNSFTVLPLPLTIPSPITEHTKQETSPNSFGST